MGCGTGKPEVHTVKQPLKDSSQINQKSLQQNKDSKNLNVGQNQNIQINNKTNPQPDSKQTGAKSKLDQKNQIPSGFEKEKTKEKPEQKSQLRDNVGGNPSQNQQDSKNQSIVKQPLKGEQNKATNLLAESNSRRQANEQKPSQNSHSKQQISNKKEAIKSQIVEKVEHQSKPIKSQISDMKNRNTETPIKELSKQHEKKMFEIPERREESQMTKKYDENDPSKQPSKLAGQNLRLSIPELNQNHFVSTITANKSSQKIHQLENNISKNSHNKLSKNKQGDNPEEPISHDNVKLLVNGQQNPNRSIQRVQDNKGFSDEQFAVLNEEQFDLNCNFDTGLLVVDMNKIVW